MKTTEHTEVRTYATSPRSKTKTKQDYGTPWDFVHAVEARFGPIVRDLAAHEKNAKAALFYDEARNSLTVPWSEEHPAGNLWLNPPFANIEPWISKAREETHVRRRRRGFLIVLTPASIGTEWFNANVLGSAYVLGLSPRLTFEGETDPYPKDLMLSIYGYGLSGFGAWRWK